MRVAMNLEKATAWYREQEQEQKEKIPKNPLLGVDLENRGFLLRLLFFRRSDRDVGRHDVRD